MSPSVGPFLRFLVKVIAWLVIAGKKAQQVWDNLIEEEQEEFSVLGGGGSNGIRGYPGRGVTLRAFRAAVGRPNPQVSVKPGALHGAST